MLYNKEAKDRWVEANSRARLSEESRQNGFKDGFADGYAQGFAQGSDGKKRVAFRIATNLLNAGLPLDEVAAFTELPLLQVSDL